MLTRSWFWDRRRLRYDGIMTAKKMFWIGAVGSVIAALCCFTPLLVILFGALGVSALLGWADLVLLPVLAGFIALTIVAAIRARRAP